LFSDQNLELAEDFVASPLEEISEEQENLQKDDKNKSKQPDSDNDDEVLPKNKNLAHKESQKDILLSSVPYVYVTNQSEAVALEFITLNKLLEEKFLYKENKKVLRFLSKFKLSIND
jgi:hypothetical protein